MDVVGLDGGAGGGDQGRLAFAEAKISRLLDRLVDDAKPVQKLLVIVAPNLVTVDQISGRRGRETISKFNLRPPCITISKSTIWTHNVYALKNQLALTHLLRS